MRTIRLLALCCVALATPALAQDSSSAEPAAPAISSAAAFKIFIDSCADLASGKDGAEQRAAAAGWTANEGQDTGPFSKVYSGYRDLDGLGEVDIWGAVYSYPTQRLGYCRVDFSDADNVLEFNDVAGIDGLLGSVRPGDNNDVYGAWETPDKTLLVIGDRTDGVVELEFNLLPGTRPAGQ